MKIDGFNILPVMSFSMAVTTFVGQNYGAGKIDRVKKGMWTTIGMGMIYTVVTGALILLFSNEIMRLFTEDKDVITYGRMAIMFFCPFYFILSIFAIIGRNSQRYWKECSTYGGIVSIYVLV